MIVSVHVPKTAGTSFAAFLREALGDGRVREEYRGGPRIEGAVSDLGALAQDLRNRGDRVRVYLRRGSLECVHGHFLASKYAFIATAFVAWVRDPVERVVSHYEYFKRQPDPNNRHSIAVQEGLGLLDFAAIPGLRNLQSRYLDLPLERFAFVGRTERLDEDMVRACEVLGLSAHESPRTNANPHRKGDRYEISDTDRARIADLNREDAALYDRVHQHFHP